MKKKMFGALALSAALAMGAVPAFAAPGVDANTSAFEEGEASTAVDIETTIKQLNVTLPVKVTLAASIGGGDATCPSDGAYKIVNSGNIDVFVTQTAAKSITNRAWGLSATPIAATTDPVSSSTTHGDIYMAIQPGTLEGDVFTLNEDVDAAVLTQATNSTYDENWKVPMKAGETDGTLPFKITASTSQLKGVTATNTLLANAIQVTYTIATAANGTGAGA